MNSAKIFDRFRLAYLIKENHETLRQAAKRCGVSWSGLRDWTIGKRTPTLECLAKLCAGYNVGADFFCPNLFSCAHTQKEKAPNAAKNK